MLALLCIVALQEPHNSGDGKKFEPTWLASELDKCFGDSSHRRIVICDLDVLMRNEPIAPVTGAGGQTATMSDPPTDPLSGYSVAAIVDYMTSQLELGAMAEKFAELVEDGKLTYKLFEPSVGAALGGPISAAERIGLDVPQARSDYNSLVVASSPDQYVGLTAVLVAHEMDHICRARAACVAPDPAVVPELLVNPLLGSSGFLFPITKAEAIANHSCMFIRDLRE